MKIVSKKQQGYFGAVASGAVKSPSLKPAKARKMLRENRGKMRNLPARASRRTPSRRGRR